MRTTRRKTICSVVDMAMQTEVREAVDSKW